jgi:gliding motility-associated transport system ATP-binding protein
VPAIQVQGLSKHYGPFVAVRNLSFDIPAGQVVALLGPNGAGKSTTMKILTGFIAATAGSARVAGFDVATQRIESAARVGYLPENGPLYVDMTPRQTLTFFGQARGIDGAALKARIDEVALQCGLDQILDKPVSKLSKGLRQRVGLAQALLHDPEVLIMDEPTSGLDPNQIREFRELVRQHRGRKTMLISTHILQEVDALADRVLLIHAGALAFDGPVGELRDRGSLEDAFYRLTQSSNSQNPQNSQNSQNPQILKSSNP